jgi:WD40 repeat protein
MVDSKNILDKKKSLVRYLCCSWSPDGLFVAAGSSSGNLSLRDMEMNMVLEADL